MRGQTDALRAKASKYSGFMSLFVALLNIGFGAFLLWVWFTASVADTCSLAEVPLFVSVAGWVSLGYGSFFAFYAGLSAIQAARRAGYEEVRGVEQDSVFDNSVFTSSAARGDVAEVPQPGGLSSLFGCLVVIVAAFRLAWLIFGTVEIFKTTRGSCAHYYIPTVVYVLTQWSLIGLVVVVLCCGCICLAYCATMLGRG